MKKLLFAAFAVALCFAIASPAQAQGKMYFGAALDALVPMSDFSNVVSVGFGADARYQYNFLPDVAGTGTLGYYSWGGKDQGPSFHAVVVKVGGKYYFPMQSTMKVYGIFEIGLAFLGSSDVTVTNAFGTFTVSGASETDFTYCPGVGLEIPASDLKVDLSIRWDGIAASGSAANSFAVRAGVNFPL